MAIALVLIAGAGLARASASASALAQAEERLARHFAASGVPFPPRTATFIAFKSEARLELWADTQFVRSYLVRARSGGLGPKLAVGDHQVPEGVYRITAFNPDSLYHLSLRLDYPSLFDRARAAEDGRTRLGGDIMIHGSDVSDGCLPVGDREIEELFSLTARLGMDNVTVIVSPVDLRRVDARVAVARAARRPAWLHRLYATITTALASFPAPGDDAPVIAPRRLVTRQPGCRAHDEADCVRRCKAGDMASCARAGVMRGQGRRAAPDLAGAWTLLGRACAGGDALGCAELSQLYVNDDGPRRDAARAAELARAACDAGNGHGCAYLVKFCTERLVYPGTDDRCTADAVRRLSERAVALLHKDCAGWGAYDCSTLATIYSPRDPDAARRFAAAACRGGEPAGCDQLASLPASPRAR